MGIETYRTSHFNAIEFPDLVDQIVLYEFEEKQAVQLGPGAYFEIIFQFSDFYQTLPKSSTWMKRPGTFIGGLHCQPFAIAPATANGKLLSIRLNAEKARKFVPGKLNFYKNRVVDLNTVFPSSRLALLSELLRTNEMSEILKMTTFFLEEIHESKPFSPIDDAVRFIKDEKGRNSLAKVSEKIGLGDSQFRKRFNEEIGLSPKEFMRVIRVNAICDYLENHEIESLTEVAYRFNYFDQSHCIKDFKSVKGITPGQFLKSL